MHIINIEEDRIGLRFGVTQENRLVLLAGPGMPLRRAVKQAIQWYPGLIREVWE